MKKHIITWMGKPLDNYSKEELIDIIEQLCYKLDDFYTPEAVRIRALGKVQRIKQMTKII